MLSNCTFSRIPSWGIGSMPGFRQSRGARIFRHRMFVTATLHASLSPAPITFAV